MTAARPDPPADTTTRTVAESRAEILAEYGPFDGVATVHGVGHDGTRVWFASGDRLNGLDPESGRIVAELAPEPAGAGDDAGARFDAGTTFDGRHLWQLAGAEIVRIDPATGEVLARLAAPEGASNSGLAWAEGSLWIGDYEGRRIREVDPETGAVRRTIASDRFVTGVTWVEGELWHGTWEDDESELRRIDPETGAVLERLAMPAGAGVSGLACDGQRFFCGAGGDGRLRAVRRPTQART